MSRRRILWIAVLGTMLVGITMLYGHVVFALYGKDVPVAWNAELYQLPHKDLVEKLGPPDGDYAGKGYQHWIKQEWWGYHELQVGYLDCCGPDSTPSSVYIGSYVKGKYDHISFRKVARGGSRGRPST